MKKAGKSILIISLISLTFLLFSGIIVSAGLFDNMFGTTEKNFNKNVGKYGKIEITKGNNLVNDITPINAECSLFNCWVEGESNIYSDNAKIFDSFNYYGTDSKEKSKYSKFFIWTTENRTREINNNSRKVIECLDTKLKENKTTCYETIYGSYNENYTYSYWKETPFEKLNSGKYKWRVEFTRNINEKLDWIPTSNGIALEEYLWFNTSWDRKKALNFSIATNPTIKDNQILLNISYDSDMQSDFKDLRFINGTETGELKFNVVQKVDGAWIKLWLRLDNNITTTNQTLAYVYYKNSTVVSSASTVLDSVFLFYDDFDADNSTKWTAIAGSESTSGGAVTIDGDWLYTTIKFGRGVYYETQMTTIGAIADGQAYNYPRDIQTDTGDQDSIFAGTNCGSATFSTSNEGTGASCGGAGVTYTTSSLIGVAHANSSYVGLYIDNSLVATDTTNIPDEDMNFTIRDWDGGSWGANFVRIRSWNDSVIYYSLGTEESQSSPNTAPTIIANATNSPIYTNTDLKVNLTITDPDAGNTLTGYVKLYVNNTPNTTIKSQTATNNTNTLIATFDSSGYNKGDNITLEVWAGDGTTNTTAVNLTNITISNSVPIVKFIAQNTPDITSTNVISNRLNISYNISDVDNDLNASSITFFYKTNNSLVDCSYYTNGTRVCGWQNGSMSTSNISEVWNFTLGDNRVYPASYNLESQNLEDTPHVASTLTNANQYLSVTINDIYENKQYGFYEQMSNSTGIQRIYYCNSTYNFGNSPSINSNCVNFYTIPAGQSFNHSHLLYSQHQFIPFVPNTTTGLLGTVKVTNTSHFITRGTTGSTINFWYINNITKTGQMRLSINNGNSWTNQTYTIDAHIHQFDGTDTFRYYVCANDTSNSQNCSVVRSDIMDLAGIPPSAPIISSPTNTTYNSNISINYSASISPNGYTISYYNISLLNSDTTFNKTIVANTSSLSAILNNSFIVDGSYRIKVESFDNLSQSSFEVSDIFSYDATNPLISLIYPTNISYIVAPTTLNYSATDTNLANCWYATNNSINKSTACGTNITGLIAYSGSNTWTIWANDSIGNINKSSVTFNYDISAPTITINFPNIDNINTNSFTISATTNEQAICNYSIDYGTNSSMDSTNNLTHTKNIVIPDGRHDFTFYCKDNAGFSNSSNWNALVMLSSGSSGSSGGSSSPSIKLYDLKLESEDWYKNSKNILYAYTYDNQKRLIDVDVITFKLGNKNGQVTRISEGKYKAEFDIINESSLTINVTAKQSVKLISKSIDINIKEKSITDESKNIINSIKEKSITWIGNNNIKWILLGTITLIITIILIRLIVIKKRK